MSLRVRSSSHNKVIIGIAIFLGCLFISGADATYAGDNPLNLTYAGTITGDYLLTTGNSTYQGSLKPGGVYSTEFNITIPENAAIRFQRLYLYWTWSSLDHKAIYPRFSVNRSDRSGEPLALVGRYTDNKGFVSTNDFFCGVDSFDIPTLSAGHDKIIISATQAGPEGSSVVIQGMALLVVYESGNTERSLLQIFEGSDLLYSSYGISPEMATQTVVFDQPVHMQEVSQAKILIVAPSGGYSRMDLPEKNRLYLNWIPDENIPPLIRTVVSVLFPTFQGKVWSDVFYSDEINQIGIEERDITAYLREQNNRIAIQDRGDYLQFCNAILSVKLKQ